MEISVDISMYPLKEAYEAPIQDFIKRLRKTEFKIVENALSTQVFGNYTAIMDWIHKNIHLSLLDEKNCVFVLKIVTENIGDYAPNF